MIYEDSEIRTSTRGKLYVIHNEKKKYVFQDPISLSYYNVSQGILLDTKIYHKKILTDYLSGVDSNQFIVPHSRRPLTTEEIMKISYKLYERWYHDFENDSIEANIITNNGGDDLDDASSVPLMRSDRASRNNRRFPRNFMIEIPEDVLRALQRVNTWYENMIEDLQL